MRQSRQICHNLRILGILSALILCCSSPEPGIQGGLTGVELEITYETSLDQFRVTGTIDETSITSPMTSPDPPRQLSQEGETLLIIVPDELDGETLRLRIEGLFQETMVVTGQTDVVLVGETFVQASVHLEEQEDPCGDGVIQAETEECDDENTVNDDGCSNQCTVEPGFHCEGEPSICQLTCGGEFCLAGQHCVDDVCLCDDSSCPDGCCQNDLCQPGDELTACGSAGSDCDICETTEACVGSICTGCTSVTCADGCCSPEFCLGSVFDSCGIDGEICQACDPFLADDCSVEGECVCGSDPQCEDGQRCSDGSCICDALSCSGCCDGDRCEDGTSDDACGTGGMACETCSGSESCDPDEGCGFILWVDDSCRASSTCGSGTESAPFETIEEALSATVTGVEMNYIRVASGTYRENEFEYHRSGRPVTIVGESGARWISSDNSALHVSGSAQVTIRNLSIQAHDSAVFCSHTSQCILDQVTLSGNSKYGIELKDSAHGVLSRCFLSDNDKAAILLDDSSSIQLFNSIIVQNGGRGAEGGAIRLKSDSTSIEVYNCTIADNDGDDRAAVICAEPGASVELSNLILWNNTSRESDQCEECTLGADSLDGSIDPLFVTAAGRSTAEDYQIQATSPACDLGTTTPETPTIDYWGELRDDGSIDSGADEYRP